MSTLIEAPSRIEPCLLHEAGAEIIDLVVELSAATHTLGSRLHTRSAEALADLVGVG